MRSLLLRPCKLRDDKFVPVKGAETEWFEWPRLVEVLAPSRSKRAITVLLEARRGSFLGVIRKPGSEVLFNFMILPQYEQNNARFLLDTNSNFPQELIKVYSVEEVRDSFRNVEEIV